MENQASPQAIKESHFWLRPDLAWIILILHCISETIKPAVYANRLFTFAVWKFMRAICECPEQVSGLGLHD